MTAGNLLAVMQAGVRRLLVYAAIAQGGFAWSDFGLGAAAMLGLVLLATGVVAGRRIPRARISS